MEIEQNGSRESTPYDWVTLGLVKQPPSGPTTANLGGNASKSVTNIYSPWM